MTVKPFDLYYDDINPSVQKSVIMDKIFNILSGTMYKSTVCLATLKETVLWNRTFNTIDNRITKTDGYVTYNMPAYSDITNYQTNYNIILPNESIASCCYFNTKDWTKEEKDELLTYFNDLLKNTLIELGFDKSRLSEYNNCGSDYDLIDDKRFCAMNTIVDDDYFMQISVITMYYKKYKDIFDKELTGQYAHLRGITGITDEMPEITPEVLRNKLAENITDFFI